jgi:dihydropteroate synthase
MLPVWVSMSASVQNPPAPNAGVVRPRAVRCGGRELALGDEPLLVGILNVTEDSFFDGGRFASLEAAVVQAARLVEEGAAVLDIGGQSTRPGYREITAEEEISRVVPVITQLAGRLNVPLSIDTYKPAVAAAALEAGAQIVNDIHGFQRGTELAGLAARAGAAAILMHNDAALAGASGDVIENITLFFRRSLDLAARAGVDPDRIILDPGIGFGKTQAQNLQILARIGELRALGFPLLLGASRKSTIGNVLDLPVDDRLEGTLATTALAAWQGVEFLRVHDVRANLRAARMAAAIRRASLS